MEILIMTVRSKVTNLVTVLRFIAILFIRAAHLESNSGRLSLVEARIRDKCNT
jgi:hypothetical protein